MAGLRRWISSIKKTVRGVIVERMPAKSFGLSKAGALVDKQQRFGAGLMLLNLCQNAASNNDSANGESQKFATIMERINVLCEKIKNVGFRNLPQGLSREMSLPRAIDIACVLYRLRDNGR